MPATASSTQSRPTATLRTPQGGSREANELGRHRREPVRCPLAVAVFIGDVLAFDVAEFAQCLPTGLPHQRIVEDANARDFRRLLRPRTQQPTDPIVRLA
jgi:hypothetical protein